MIYLLKLEAMNVSNIYVTGITSEIKRKSLPEIAKIVGISSPQSLHHFLANSPWSATKLKERRLSLTLEALKEQKITLVIDETLGNLYGAECHDAVYPCTATCDSDLKSESVGRLRTWVEYGFRQCKQELG